MLGKLKEYSDSVYVLVRVVVGILFVINGMIKFAKGMPQGLMLAAMLIEVIGGVLIILGLFTRYAAIISAVEMIVAFVMAHAPKGLNPVTNGGEPAILFLLFFLLIATQGAGKLSLDSMWAKD